MTPPRQARTKAPGKVVARRAAAKPRPARDSLKAAGTREQPPPAAANAGVMRAFALVSLLAQDDRPLTLTELAAPLNLSRSTTFKLLQTLASIGVVAYDARLQVYRPGADLFRLATVVLRSGSFVEIARIGMRELTAQTGESSCLNLLDAGREAFTVAAVEESASPLQYVLDLGQWHPLHGGASGKAILAFCPPELVARVLQARLVQLTPATVQDAKVLERQLAEVRKQGYSISIGERLVGAVGIAAPIRDASGFAVASVQVTIPQHRFDRRRLPVIARHVMQAADRIGSAVLGSRRPS